MLLPEAFVAMLLEEIGRPALVFVGKKLLLANHLAIERWGDIPAADAPPKFLSQTQWSVLEGLLEKAQQSSGAVSGHLTIDGITYLTRCVRPPSCHTYFLCHFSPDTVKLQDGLSQVSPAVDGLIYDERVRDLCLRQLFDSTKIWYKAHRVSRQSGSFFLQHRLQ